MKYILIDSFDNTEKEVNEYDLRNIYYNTMDEIVFNWKDCDDKELVKGLEKERDEAYTLDIKNIIKVIEEDNWFYKVKEV